MPSNKNILITGYNGFIGQNIRKALLAKHYTVIQLSSDVRLGTELKYSLNDLKSNIEDLKVDAVIHCAANPNGNANFQAYKDNVEMAYQIAELTPKNVPIIFTSSITVYGDNTWCKENEFHNLRPTTLYGLSKLASEDILNMYGKRNGNRICCLRLCATVGNNMTHGFVHDLIKKIQAPGDSITLFGEEPGTCKQYIHVDDVVNAVIYCLSNYTEIRCMNVVPKYSPLTVKEIAHEVMDILGIRKEIIWDKSKVWAGDNKLLAADGGLYHSLRLSDNSSLTSIRKVANEYRNNNNSGK